MMGITEQELERRKQFLQFEPADEERLKNLVSLSEGNADAIIEAFYEHLLSLEEMRSFFPDPESSPPGLPQTPLGL